MTTEQGAGSREIELEAELVRLGVTEATVARCSRCDVPLLDGIMWRRQWPGDWEHLCEACFDTLAPGVRILRVVAALAGPSGEQGRDGGDDGRG
jgi:hypothetical protein